MVQRRPKWDRTTAINALTNGSKLRLSLIFGGGWFILKPGEADTERTRFPLGVAERLLADHLIEPQERDGGIYGLSVDGKEWISKYGRTSALPVVS
jgi:hypothetical protein